MNAARETVGRAKGRSHRGERGEAQARRARPRVPGGGRHGDIQTPWSSKEAARRRAIARRPTTGSVQLESRAEAEA
jgi:hypothetical protein